MAERNITPEKDAKGIDELAERGRQVSMVDRIYGEENLPFDQKRIENDCVELMRRTGIEMFLLGRNLILLKEHLPHGEFTESLERIGMNDSTSRKIMNATVRLADKTGAMLHPNLQGLPQSKLLELVALDDEDLEELKENGTVADLKLDAVQKMSVRELRGSLKDVKNEKKALEEQLTEKNKKIDELDRELQLLKKPSQWSDRAKRLVLEIGTISVQFNVIANDLHKMFEEINELQPAGWSNEKDILRSRSQEVMREMFDKMEELGDVVDWIAPADNDLLQSRHRMQPLDWSAFPAEGTEDSEDPEDHT